jgi:hypothetical protein
MHQQGACLCILRCTERQIRQVAFCPLVIIRQDLPLGNGLLKALLFVPEKSRGIAGKGMFAVPFALA